MQANKKYVLFSSQMNDSFCLQMIYIFSGSTSSECQLTVLGDRRNDDLFWTSWTNPELLSDCQHDSMMRRRIGCKRSQGNLELSCIHLCGKGHDDIHGSNLKLFWKNGPLRHNLVGMLSDWETLYIKCNYKLPSSPSSISFPDILLLFFLFPVLVFMLRLLLLLLLSLLLLSSELLLLLAVMFTMVFSSTWWSNFGDV